MKKDIMGPIAMFEKVYNNKADKDSTYPDSDTLRFYIALSGFLYRIFVKEKGSKIKAENDLERDIEIMKAVAERINKHPIIWKLFFMI